MSISQLVTGLNLILRTPTVTLNFGTTDANGNVRMALSSSEIHSYGARNGRIRDLTIMAGKNRSVPDTATRIELIDDPFAEETELFRLVPEADTIWPGWTLYHSHRFAVHNCFG